MILKELDNGGARVQDYIENSERLPDGRYRFHENYRMSKENLIESSVKESESIIEAGGETYPVKNRYLMKVWKQNENNKNGRRYDKVLESILNACPVTLGLADHPEGDKDGNPKDIWAVQKSPQMREGWLCVEVIPVGSYGALAEEVMSNGGFISISSSAIGQVDYEGFVVNDGFVLERYGDWVMNPSNGVKHFETEAKINETTPSKKDVTIYNIDNSLEGKECTEEKKVMINDKVLEKSLEANIKTLLKEGLSIEDPHARVKFLREDVITSFTDSDSASLIALKERVNNGIDAAEKEAEDQISSLKNSVADSEKLKESNESFSDVIQKQKAIIEGLKKKLEISNTLAEKKVENLEKKKEILERDSQELMHKALEAKDDKKVGDKKGAMRGPRAISRNTEKYGDRRQRQETHGFEKKNRNEHRSIRADDLRRLARSGRTVNNENHFEDRSNRRYPEGMKEMRRNRPRFNHPISERSTRYPEDMKQMRRSQFNRGEHNRLGVKNFEKVRNNNYSKVNDSMGIRIHQYFEDMKRTNPNLSTIKKEIRECKTLEEAQVKVINFLSKEEDLTSVKESVAVAQTSKETNVRSVKQVLNNRKS